MREVEPSVRLIARPQVDWEAVGEYLEEVGGIDWLKRTNITQEAKEAEGQDLIEFGGRLCYRSWEPGLNPNVTRIRADQETYFANLLASGHGSVLEHANYTFIFHNVSRVFTHELCRHRAGCAISQESMRFVRLTDIPFWLPEWAKEDPALKENIDDLVDSLEAFQRGMAKHFKLDEEGVPFAEKKAKTSFMRRFAPDGVATGLVWTANVRALRHVITMRTDGPAEEEIRLVFDKVAEIMQREAPLLFSDMDRDETGQWTPTHRKV